MANSRPVLGSLIVPPSPVAGGRYTQGALSLPSTPRSPLSTPCYFSFDGEAETILIETYLDTFRQLIHHQIEGLDQSLDEIYQDVVDMEKDCALLTNEARIRPHLNLLSWLGTPKPTKFKEGGIYAHIWHMKVAESIITEAEMIESIDQINIRSYPGYPSWAVAMKELPGQLDALFKAKKEALEIWETVDQENGGNKVAFQPHHRTTRSITRLSVAARSYPSITGAMLDLPQLNTTNTKVMESEASVHLGIALASVINVYNEHFEQAVWNIVQLEAGWNRLHRSNTLKEGIAVSAGQRVMPALPFLVSDQKHRLEIIQQTLENEATSAIRDKEWERELIDLQSFPAKNGTLKL